MMEVPQSDKPQKRRRAPRKTWGGVEYWCANQRGRFLAQPQKDGSLTVEGEFHDGRREVARFSATLPKGFGEGFLSVFADPRIAEKLQVLAAQLASASARHAAHTAPPEPSERDTTGWKAADEARMATLNRIAKGKGADSWEGLLKPALNEAHEAAGKAEAAALAEYDAAHGTAEA